jgi:hypothetical protein
VRRFLAAAAALAAVLPAFAASGALIETPHFVLAGHAGEENLRKVAANLELFHWGFLQFFDMPQAPVVRPTKVLLVRNNAERRALWPVFDGRPVDVDGYFRRGENFDFIVLSASKATSRIAYHEYVHRLTSRHFDGLPHWFQEGFAECFSNLEIEGGDGKLRLGRVITPHLALLRGKPLMPLEQLFAVTGDSSEYNEREPQQLFYAQSWAVVHYLMLGRGGALRPQLDAFLVGLRRGEPAVPLFKRVFGMELRAFQKDVEGYVRERLAWPIMEISNPEEFTAADAPIRLLSDAEWQFHLGDLLVHSGRLPEAEVRLQNASRLDPLMVPAPTAIRLPQSNLNVESTGARQSDGRTANDAQDWSSVPVRGADKAWSDSTSAAPAHPAWLRPSVLAPAVLPLPFDSPR